MVIVPNHLKTLSPVTEMSLKDLTTELSTLLCLLSGQRCQTVHKLDIDFIQESDGNYLTVREKLKHTRPGKHLEPLEFKKVEPDNRLCVAAYLKEYILRTKTLRGPHTKLLISYVKPHKPVSKDTLASCVKSVLKDAGVDITRFSAHSCRAAATSSSNSAGLSLVKIVKAAEAGWSNAGTFAKIYNKPMMRENFGETLLKQLVHSNVS